MSFLIKKYTSAIVEGCRDIDKILYIDDNKMKSSFQLAGELRKEKYDAAVVLFPTFRIAFALFLAGIPVRIGSGYRSYSFLFNNRVYEHRKYAEKHEVEFNLSLLERLGISEHNPEFNFDVNKSNTAEAEEVLIRNKISPERKLVIIHPGSGGSALDWPEEHFGTLAKFISEIYDVDILVTWGESEYEKADMVNKISGGKCKILSEVLPLELLIAVIRKSDLVITNSTGPIHIAVMLEREVIGFYPPILPCSYKRWGPYGKEENVFVPDLPPCKQCVSGKCKYFDCMDRITPEMVFKKVKKVLNEKK